MKKLKPSDVQRIKSGHAKGGDGTVSKGSFPAKAESVVAKRDKQKGGDK